VNPKLSSKKARRSPSPSSKGAPADAGARAAAVAERSAHEEEEVDESNAPAAERKAGRPRVAPNSGDVFGAAELARQVAEALRHHRRTQQLSLDDLAQRSGVSRAALSQIEGARTNPTLSVLWKIAVGLGMPFQELLGTQSSTGPRVLRAGDTPALRTASGQMESRLLSPGGSSPGVEVYELRLAPRGSHPSEPHSVGTTETVIVLTGALRMIIDEQSYDLATGDSIFFNADVRHVYESRSSHATRCINVISYTRS
jgi:transcriptional regulator with XRE-family HTH domain